MPTLGSTWMSGTSRAWMRMLRSWAPYSARAAASSRATSRSSAAKALTTRTPETASSTTPATSAARCWAAQVAGKTRSRMRPEATARAGSTTRAMAVSAGLRASMTTSDSTSITRLPIISGRKASSICTMRTSLPARDIACPVSSRSWAAKSSRARCS